MARLKIKTKRGRKVRIKVTGVPKGKKPIFKKKRKFKHNLRRSA